MTRELSGVPVDLNNSGSQILEGLSQAIVSLMTQVSGAGVPSANLQIGLRVMDTTEKVYKVWDGADWRIEGPRHVDASSFEWIVDLGALSGTTTKWLPVPRTGVYIESFALISDTSTTSDGSNKWTVQLTNVSATENLFATAPTTNGSEITANTAWIQTCDQNNNDIAAGSALKVVLTETGSATTLANAAIVIRGRRLGA